MELDMSYVNMSTPQLLLFLKRKEEEAQLAQHPQYVVALRLAREEIAELQDLIYETQETDWLRL